VAQHEMAKVGFDNRSIDVLAIRVCQGQLLGADGETTLL